MNNNPLVSALNAHAKNIKNLLEDNKKVQNFGDEEQLSKNLEGLANKQAHLYAIFENDEIRYVGKSKTITKRLTDHFIGCSDSTSSIFENYHTRKSMKVAIVPVDTELYSSLEEALETLFRENKEETYEFWGRRKG